MTNSRDLPLPSSVTEDLRDDVSWRHPTGKMQICMRAESVQLLAGRSLRQLKASPPSELGGILWGKLVPAEQNASALFLVPGLVSAEAPLFNTTENDLQSLITALEHPPQYGLQAIGFFRSHLREGLCLSRQDETFIEQFIRNPDSAFLIIRPFEVGLCMAGFFFWEHGRLQTDVSDLEVPFVAPEDRAYPHDPLEFDRPRFSVRDVSSRTIPVVETPLPPPPKAPQENIDAEPVTPSTSPRPPRPMQSPTTQQGATPSRPDPRHRYSWKLVLSSVLLLWVCLGTYFVAMRLGLHPPSSTTAVPKTPVTLQANIDSNGQIDLSWDQTSPNLRKAQGAKLTIIDGTLHRELNIDQSQLRFGKLAYFPNSDDVQFYLEIHLDASRSVAESVRVLPRIGVFSRVVQGASGGLAGVQIEPRATSNSRRSLSTNGNRPVSLARNSSPRGIPPAKEAARSFPGVWPAVTRPAVPHPPSSSQFAPPPPLDPIAGVDNPIARVRVLPIPPPPPPQANAQGSAASSTLSANSGPAYVPARPLKQVLPITPISGYSRTYPVTSVTVQVEINEEGRVTAVHVTPGAPGESTVLTAQAILAAKQWTFRPATLHGKKVSSDHTIIFRFRPAE